MKKLLFSLSVFFVGILPMMADNNFTLLHDIASISFKDSNNHDWDGGYYTQNPIVKVGYECDDSNVHSVRVAIEKCNGIVRANHTYTLLEYAVQDNSSDIAISVNGPNSATCQFNP